MESSKPVLSSAIHALTMEMKRLHREPVEGFSFKLVDDNNLFTWEVAIFGPPDTLYEGGYFKALMQFPPDYPYSPPTFRFLCEMWHPNIYKNGAVCISILHPPVNDPHSGEEASERWNPTQNVRTVLLSIISLLNEPNTSSPANVDASVTFRNWKDGVDNTYENIVKQQVLETQQEADKDGITVPTTVTEYCVSHGLDCSQSCDEVEYECFDPEYDYCDHDDDDIDMDNE